MESPVTQPKTTVVVRDCALGRVPRRRCKRSGAHRMFNAEAAAVGFVKNLPRGGQERPPRRGPRRCGHSWCSASLASPSHTTMPPLVAPNPVSAVVISSPGTQWASARAERCSFVRPFTRLFHPLRARSYVLFDHLYARGGVPAALRRGGARRTVDEGDLPSDRAGVTCAPRSSARGSGSCAPVRKVVEASIVRRRER